MIISKYRMSQAQNLKVGGVNKRIVLDPRGVHHKTVPARDLEQFASIHIEGRKNSVAETLLMIRRLRNLGAVHAKTDVHTEGAIYQAFRGSQEIEASHTAPCQLILDGVYLHQVCGANGKMLGTKFIVRAMKLAAHTSYVPGIINHIDSALDAPYGGQFVEMFKESIEGVLAGHPVLDVYREFAMQKRTVLNDLSQRARDEPLGDDEAMVLMGATSSVPDERVRLSHHDPSRSLGEKQYRFLLKEQKLVIVDTYAYKERADAVALATGDLKAKINNEDWK